MALINEMPSEIVALAKKRQKEYIDKHGCTHCNHGINVNSVEYMFLWSKSPEGFNFWNDIQNGIYSKFYEKYPKLSTYEIY